MFTKKKTTFGGYYDGNSVTFGEYEYHSFKITNFPPVDLVAAFVGALGVNLGVKLNNFARDHNFDLGTIVYDDALILTGTAALITLPILRSANILRRNTETHVLCYLFAAAGVVGGILAGNAIAPHIMPTP